MDDKQKANKVIKLDNSANDKKFCCITGNRMLEQESLLELTKKIKKELNNAVENGYSIFVCSAEVGFEMICSSIIVGLREKNIDIQLILAVPFSDKNKHMTVLEQQLHDFLMKEADKVLWIEDEERSKMVIDVSDMCISYLKYTGKYEGEMIKLAKEKGISIVSI